MRFSLGAPRCLVKQVVERAALIEMLKGFEPFERLDDDDLVFLVTRSEVETSVKRRQLFSVGDDDPWMFCLMEGTSELVAGDGRRMAIDAGTTRARRPVAQLKPRVCSAVTTTPIRFVRIDSSGFSEITPPIETDDYLVAELQEGDLDAASDTHQDRLRSDRLILPALPEVALTTCRLVDNDQVDSGTVAQAVSRDAVISAKLIKAANSPIFYGRSTINSLDRAVSRLGLRTIRQLVVSFALQDLFKHKSPLLAARMRSVWDHSVEVSAISFLLAQRLELGPPEEAPLAGLIHDVPIVPILGYAQSQPDLLERPGVLEALVKRLRPEIGERLLTSWSFPQNLLTAVTQSENWWRDSARETDLADVVLIAQLLSFIGKSKPPDVPNISRLPAFRKLSGGRLDADAVTQMLRTAKQQLAELRALFSME
jgi:HD-like signal output (HDOD) protein